MQRSPVPDWARPQENPSKISPPQRKFIKSLAEKKQFPDQAAEDRLWKMLRISEDPEEIGITKAQASKIIDWLKEQPNKPRAQAVTTAAGKGGEAVFVPAGRYAVENAEGELRFYHVWRPKDNEEVLCLYVLHGPDETRIQGKAMWSIIQKIADAGIEEAAVRYGHEIGQCSSCGRRLTNRVSRELGIGPVCGGRMFEDFGEKVSNARQAILARGEDPDEELTSEGWPPVERASAHLGVGGCDVCGATGVELYHNDRLGLSVCEKCDADAPVS